MELSAGKYSEVKHPLPCQSYLITVNYVHVFTPSRISNKKVLWKDLIDVNVRFVNRLSLSISDVNRQIKKMHWKISLNPSLIPGYKIYVTYFCCYLGLKSSGCSFNNCQLYFFLEITKAPFKSHFFYYSLLLWLAFYFWRQSSPWRKETSYIE